MSLSKKVTVALAAGAGLLAASSVAGAVDLPELPDAAEASQVAQVENSGDDKAAEHRQDGDHAAPAVHEEGEGDRPTDTHGYEVSQLATTTDLEGRAKGAAISTLARTNGEATSEDHAQPEASGADAAAAGKAKGAAARGGHGR